MNESKNKESNIRKIVIEFEPMPLEDGLAICADMLSDMKLRNIKLKSFWANGGNIKT